MRLSATCSPATRLSSPVSRDSIPLEICRIPLPWSQSSLHSRAIASHTIVGTAAFSLHGSSFLNSSTNFRSCLPFNRSRFSEAFVFPFPFAYLFVPSNPSVPPFFRAWSFPCITISVCKAWPPCPNCFPSIHLFFTRNTLRIFFWRKFSSLKGRSPTATDRPFSPTAFGVFMVSPSFSNRLWFDVRKSIELPLSRGTPSPRFLWTWPQKQISWSF